MKQPNLPTLLCVVALSATAALVAQGSSDAQRPSDAKRPSNAQGLSEAQRGVIERLGKPWNKPGSPGFSVAITRGQKLIYKAGFGHAQIEYDVPIDADTVFHVASVSKQFTAFAIVLLAEDGKLSLDDEVRKHIPWLHDFGKPITIRHLLHHTSGLRDQWELLSVSGNGSEDVRSQSHILRLLRRQRELNFEPGSRFMYCNSGYTLAAHIVERVSGQSFRDFCRTRIFAPLGMKHSHFHEHQRRVVPKRAYSYSPRRSKPIPWQKRVLSYATVGATSLFTTAPDLARWLANLGSGKVGGLRTVKARRQRGKLNDGRALGYGLGVFSNRYRGYEMLEHGGRDAAFLSHVAYLPELDLGIAVCSNASSANPRRVVEAIRRMLVVSKAKKADTSAEASKPSGTTKTARAAKSTKAAASTTPPHIEIKQMLGRYSCPEPDVIYEIAIEDGQPLARNLRWGKLTLARGGPQTLRGRPYFFRRLDFEVQASKVTGFKLSGSRVHNLRFVRMR